MADLAGHRPRIEAPASAQVFGGTLSTCGAWSQGPALTQTLMIYEALPLLDTSVVAVVDAEGNVCAATPSDSAADGPVVPGLGFVISTRGAQSHAESGHRARVAPGVRPTVTACPMLFVSSDGRVIAGGGPGGDRQLQAMARVLARHLAWGRSLVDAAAAPRVFTQSAPTSNSPHLAFPGWVLIEQDVPDAEAEALAARGHRVARIPSKGALSPSVCLVETGAAGYAAVGDPRRQCGLQSGRGPGTKP
jgi:gamma-glutamyltranspeptidase/glutathione hydrolase